MSKENSIGIALLTLLLLLFMAKNGGGRSESINNSNGNIKSNINNYGSKEDKNKEIKKNDNISDVDKIRLIKSKNINDESNEIVLENEAIKVYFSKTGGCISKVILKDYINNNSQSVTLLDKTNVINLKLADLDIDTYNLIFSVSKVSENEIVFSSTNDLDIKISYKLDKKNKFVIKQVIDTNSSDIKFLFNNILAQQEFDLNDCKNKSVINYFENGAFKSLVCSQNMKATAKVDDCQWIAFKQKFFTSGLFCKNKMKGELFIKDTNKGVRECNLSVGLMPCNRKCELDYFFGPNKYSILKSFADSFEKNMYLGPPIVSHFNTYVVLPLFEYIGHNIPKFFIILLLVLFIKLLILPINFKIYIITQKIKLLNKIIVILKEKYSNNQQMLAIEQVNLYREFGVNPLLVLLYNIIQFPFIIAIYNFIPIEIMFRHSKFLWCNDISASDSIVNFGFYIPFYGDHVSISSILMGLTMLLYFLLNGDQFNERSSKIGFTHIFIVGFMICISNRFCCALNIYYIFFNLFTFFVQFLFSRYIDDSEFRNRINVKINQIR